jgi:hypothetical protein
VQFEHFYDAPLMAELMITVRDSAALADDGRTALRQPNAESRQFLHHRGCELEVDLDGLAIGVSSLSMRSRPISDQHKPIHSFSPSPVADE